MTGWRFYTDIYASRGPKKKKIENKMPVLGEYFFTGFHVIFNQIGTCSCFLVLIFSLVVHCQMSRMSGSFLTIWWSCCSWSDIQSTLVISNSKGLSEILRGIRTSTYQICRIEENIIGTTTFNKFICNLKLEVYWKYCGKEEKLLLGRNFSSFPQLFTCC